MAYICADCGKKTAVGRSQQHRRGVAGKRWKKRVVATKRLFRPNIQTITLMQGNKKLKVKLCAKCIKKRKKTSDILV